MIFSIRRFSPITRINPDETWETTTDVPNGGWQCHLHGIKIIDDDGNAVDPLVLHNAIKMNVGEEFWEIDYTGIKP